MLTDEERRNMKPIFGTDLSKPASELLQGWRDDMTKMRGQLSDLTFALPWTEQYTKHLEGLLTCGIVTLCYEVEQAKKAETVRSEAAK